MNGSIFKVLCAQTGKEVTSTVSTGGRLGAGVAAGVTVAGCGGLVAAF